mmetsp:Transcript_21457/g.49992  ORF Transcript_21457/g.49992 Transcript_21457/m.49992 type:complete len:216 (-) Transcript_21457:429-1076(-)
MHETALNLLQGLDLVLQQDAAVVAVTQRRRLRHHHLQLYQIPGPEVIGAQLVKLHPLRVMGLHNAADFLQEIRVRTLADDHLNLFKPRHKPGIDDVNRDSNSGHRVNDPERVAQDDHLWCNQGCNVGDDVVLVVLRDGLHRINGWVALGNACAPSPQPGLEENDHDEHQGCAGGQRRCRCIFTTPKRHKLHRGLANDLHGCHPHNHGTNHDANRL